MFREITISTKQDGGYRRRWYEDERMDLFVWFGTDDGIVHFQLTYDKPYPEKAIDWKRERGFTHSRIDDGARLTSHPGTPLMIYGGAFAKDRVIAEFRERATDIDSNVAAFVMETLREFANEPGSAALDKPRM